MSGKTETIGKAEEPQRKIEEPEGEKKPPEEEFELRGGAYACKVCKASFSKNSTMQRHLKIHKPPCYQCSKCQKEFRDASVLKRHSRVHFTADEKRGLCKHVCDHCEKRFASEWALNRHMTVHFWHSSSPQCTVCRKQFRDANKLKRHALVHKKKGGHIVCPYGCGGKFQGLARLTAHMSRADPCVPDADFLKNTPARLARAL